jgi:TolA-binding protein
LRRSVAACLGSLLLLGGCAQNGSSPKPPLAAAAAPAPPPAPAPSNADSAREGTKALEQQLARISDELNETQNALARLIATQRQQEDRLELIERRMAEMVGRTRNAAPTAPPGFAPTLPPVVSPSPSPSSSIRSPATPPAAAPAAAPSLIRPPAPPSSPRTADDPAARAIYDAGMAALTRGDRDAAVLQFYELIANHPDHQLREQAQFQVAEIYYEQHDCQAAVAELASLLAAVPKGSKTPEALLRLGLCRRTLGDEAGARQAWERLVSEYGASEPARQARQLLQGRRRG